MRMAILVFLAIFNAHALAAPVAFVDVNVVPMDEDRLLTGQTVVVEDGRIVALGASDHVEVPEEAIRVAGRGRYLMPGLAEMHAHVPTFDEDIERVLALFLANGVTTMRGMLGASVHLRLREQLASGERLGPRLVTSGPSLNGSSVSSPAQAREMIRKQHAAGYDFLKLHPGLSREQFDAIVETANELDMPFAGHVSGEVGLARALEAQQDSIDHLDGYMQALVRDGESLRGKNQSFFGLALAAFVDDAKIDAIARRTAAAGVWNVPTQSLIEHYASAEPAADLAARHEMRYMPAGTVARWRRTKEDFVGGDSYDAQLAARAIDIRRRLIKALADNGAGLLLGSDAPQVFNVPGFATREELELLVTAGLTPFQALAAGTVNPARYFGKGSSRGQVAEGHDADLVLLEGNPLRDIAHTRRIAGVMIAGRWLDRDALDALLAKFEREDEKK